MHELAAKNAILFLEDLKIGRCNRIRTYDPLHPMQVRYQAAPHTDQGLIIPASHATWYSIALEFHATLDEQIAI